MCTFSSTTPLHTYTYHADFFDIISPKFPYSVTLDARTIIYISPLICKLLWNDKTQFKVMLFITFYK